MNGDETTGLTAVNGRVRSQVAIIGAGPAGMVLAHLLHRAGVDVVVLEQRSRSYVEGRVRAGVLEPTTVAVLDGLGLTGRLQREGLRHEGVSVVFDGEVLRLDITALTGGSAVTIYGQQEVMHDLFEAAAGRGIPVEFECADVRLEGVADDPRVSWRTEEAGPQSLHCDFIAGCDGQHGVSQASFPEGVLQTYERSYASAWLGLLADVPPAAPELIYSHHERGFALASMRSATRSRYYLQCPLETRIEDWSDGRFWDEVELRLGMQAAARLTRGPSFEKSLAPLRSAVREPMQFGRLFLAGDAAHVVPPTGAKGMNLAVADACLLAEGLVDHYAGAGPGALATYSERALRRIWQAERFSWWFTRLTHALGEADEFERRLQRAEFDHLVGSVAMQTAFARSYAGLEPSGHG
jgi:p-hydroxybenzoate 3-monooxygenase